MKTLPIRRVPALACAVLAPCVILFACLSAPAPRAVLHAQAPARIVVPPEPGRKPAAFKSLVAGDVQAKPGELIEIRSEAEGEVAWLYDAREFDAEHSRVYGNVLVLTTGRPGVYSISMVAWDAKRIQQVLVTVAGPVPVPAPAPEPDPLPPDAPVNPSAAKAVAALAGFKVQSSALADFFAAWSQATSRDVTLKTTGQFRLAYRNALTSFVASADYKGAPAIGAAVDAFLLEATGTLVDGELTPALRAKLVTAFADLSVALRSLN